MNFQSFGFLAFLAAATAVCLGLARWDRRIAAKCLTLACLIFYIIGGGWAALLVLVLGMAVSAAAVRYLTMPDVRIQPEGDGPAADAYPRTAARRRRCLYLAAAWHIGVLAVFKYTGFVTGDACPPAGSPWASAFSPSSSSGF